MEIGKKMVGLQAYKYHCDTGLYTHGGGWGTWGLTRKKPAGAHLANLNGLDLSCRQLGREASWPTLFLGESLLSKQGWLSTIYSWSPEPCSFLFLCQWVGSGREDHPLGVTTHTSDFHGNFSKPYGMRKAYSEIWKENSPMLSLTLVFPAPQLGLHSFIMTVIGLLLYSFFSFATEKPLPWPSLSPMGR